MMSAFEKVEHTRNLARLRQKKYYVLHKGEISIINFEVWPNRFLVFSPVLGRFATHDSPWSLRDQGE